MRGVMFLLICLLVSTACTIDKPVADKPTADKLMADKPATDQPVAYKPVATRGEGLAKATFAGGCFWCMEPPYDKLEGVVSTTSGYIGGDRERATYKAVSAGITDHAEAVQVLYDPGKISYAELLEVFWRNVDPLDSRGQFCDKGDQYRTGIFYHDEDQKRLAEQSKQALAQSDRFEQPLVTEIMPAGEFYPAEDYHQDYYQKNPVRYKFYRLMCGRDQRLQELWGESS